ncbi:MAG: AraC family transcriptional regulator [Candidatus Pelagadaptatus aseana]|uniref:AraC family transcriptional regulator n=1 Tax=Candidatus Pelagadaptatus aseana TaxID=3120508 RepID=UPI0039B1EE1E
MSQIYSYYVKLLLDHAESIGFSADDLLTRIGLDRATLDGEQTVDTLYSAELIRTLWEETDDEQLLMSRTPVKKGLFYLAAKLTLHGSCLNEGLRDAFQLFTIATESIRPRLVVIDDRAIITIEIDSGDKDPNHFLVDLNLSSWHRFPSWLIGCQIPLLKTALPFPERDALRYELIFQSPVEYSQAHASIEFDAKYLTYRSIRTRSELRDFIRRSPADILRTSVKDLSYEGQIKAMVLGMSQSELTFPSFEELADKTNTSPQTLRRRLKAEGTSYQNIKDILRRDHCIEHLIKTQKPLAEIAAIVGFTEPATLSRTFKRWTGFTPQQYRNRYGKNSSNG